MEILTTVHHHHNNNNNNNNNHNSTRHSEETAGQTGGSEAAVYLVIYSLVLVLGVSGNGVVIWVTAFRMKKRTVNTVWHLNLAVADFLATAILPLKITYFALGGRWPLGSATCKVDDIVFYTNMYASVYTLVVISVDRCVCVACPVWTQNHRAVRKASWVSVGVWALALALSSPYFSSLGDTESLNVYIICLENIGLSMAVSHFLAGFVVPFAVIVSCYSVIVWRLRSSRSLAGQTRRRPVKIIAAVIGAFFLCWAPYHAVFVVLFVAPGGGARVTVGGARYGAVDVVFPVTLGLALLNSCLNPLLYVFMGRDSKDAFRRSILKVLEKAFAEELPRRRTGDTASDSELTRTRTLQPPPALTDVNVTDDTN